MGLIEKGKKVVVVRGADAGKIGEVISIENEKGKGVMAKIKIGNKERVINIRHIEVIKE